MEANHLMVRLELRMFEHVLMGDADRVRFSGAIAVKIATIHSARSLGVEEEFGSIESGKTADLVILDGDPLGVFSILRARQEVCHEGVHRRSFRKARELHGAAHPGQGL